MATDCFHGPIELYNVHRAVLHDCVMFSYTGAKILSRGSDHGKGCDTRGLCIGSPIKYCDFRQNTLVLVLKAVL